MKARKNAALTLTVAGAVTAAVLAGPSAWSAPAGGPGDPPPDDTAPPVITVERPAGDVDGWYAGPADVAIRVTDAHTGDLGVRQVRFELTGATTDTRTVSYSPREREVRLPLRISTEGSTRIAITATDGAEHQSTATHWVGVDTTAPTVTIGSPVDGAVVPVGAAVPVHYACGDPTSAVVSCEGSHPDGASLDTSRPGPHTVTVTARDLVGHTSTRQASIVVAESFRVLQAPRITGEPVAGRRLGVTWPDLVPRAQGLTFEWRLDGHTTGSGDVIELTGRDLGKAVSLTVTAVHKGYVTETWELDAGTVRLEVGIGSEPVVIGTPSVGQRLQVQHGEISPPSSVSYQWLRNGEPIPGGQGTYLTLGPADAGATISVRVTAVSASAGTRTWVSPVVGPVTPGPTTTPTPTTDPVPAPVVAAGTGAVTGTARLGERLTATAPAWSVPGVVTGLEWLRDGVAVPGATGATYVLGVADLGARVSVRFTGTATGRLAGVSTTAPTRRVGKALPRVRARRAGGTIDVRIDVASRAGIAATGKVSVKVAGRTHTATLRRGRAVLRVGRVPAATRLVVRYHGSRLVRATRGPVRR